MTAATKADRVAVARLVLDGLAHGEPLDNVLGRLRRFADYRFPFPGDVLTEIAAGALDVAGATRATPLSLSDATERHLPEWTVSGDTARQKHRAAFQAGDRATRRDHRRLRGNGRLVAGPGLHLPRLRRRRRVDPRCRRPHRTVGDVGLRGDCPDAANLDHDSRASTFP